MKKYFLVLYIHNKMFNNFLNRLKECFKKIRISSSCCNKIEIHNETIIKEIHEEHCNHEIKENTEIHG
jgi:hypothetical protein